MKTACSASTSFTRKASNSGSALLALRAEVRAALRPQTGDERVPAKSEGIGSEPLHARGELIAELDAAELADIVIDQQSPIKREDGVAVRPERRVEKQLAGHAEVDAEAGARIGE